MPPSAFSGDTGPSASYGGPQSGPGTSEFGPEFVPGELLRVQSTQEDGGYVSETQERGLPPPPPPFAYEAEVFTDSPGPGPAAPLMIAPGYFYPYDWHFLTGQYPPGTHTHSSSSVERGRDSWQENHYLRYDSSSNPGQQQDGGQQVQTFPSV